MQVALALARQGEGLVEPNPLVGCVLVGQDGQLLGQGFHARFGEAHAECNAIAAAVQSGHVDKLRGSTAYITLEPCCHHGKTPPCTDALLQIGIARAVIALEDPFEQVSGQGIASLRSAGVEITLGVQRSPAQELNAPFLKRIEQQYPWMIAKWAMSLDGKIATRTGDSQWISGEASRDRVQQLRSRVDAVLIGIGTALADNPLLTARTLEPPLRTAVRVVVDSRLRIETNSRLVTTARQTPLLLWAGPAAQQQKAHDLRQLGCQVVLCDDADPLRRLDELLRYLTRQYAATNVLVEGGAELLGSLLALKQIDQCEVFVAPKLIGGEAAISPVGGLGISQLVAGPQARGIRVEACGEDAHLQCRLNWQV